MGLIRTIGVIGGGIMGTGIAHDAANHGLGVIIVETSAAQRETCEQRIRADARMYRLAGIVTAPAAFARISVKPDLDSLADADFVIESMTESLPAKRTVFERADRICRPDVVFASNTSAIPIAHLAAATKRPDRVLGMHFMNPAPLQSTVEIARGTATSQATVDAALELCAVLGKVGIVVRDSPGFVSNRVLMLAVNEAAALVGEGVANAEDVDRVFTECMHHKMGPLATADLIGLDTVLLTLEVLGEELGRVKFEPTPLLRELVSANKLGRKTGEGFHLYE